MANVLREKLMEDRIFRDLQFYMTTIKVKNSGISLKKPD